MNTAVEHLEYLLGERDSVVLPGCGIFVARYEGARYAAVDVSQGAECTLEAPRRFLTFDGSVAEDPTEVLYASVARRQKVSLQQARLIVGADVEQLRRQLELSGKAAVGALGRFQRRGSDGRVVFVPNEYGSPVNDRFYGLGPVKARALRQAVPERDLAVAAPNLVQPASLTLWQRIGGYASAAAAVVAVAVTASLLWTAPAPENLHMPVAQTQEAPRPAQSVVRRLTVGMAPEKPMLLEASEGAEAPVRLDASDPFGVVVASFATLDQARQFLREHSREALEIAAAQGRQRVIAATAATAVEAERVKALLTPRYPQAWVTRR